MTMRTITEQAIFTRDEIEAAVKTLHRMQIVGGLYYGDFGDQAVRWETDGSCTVVTSHTPAPPWYRHG